MNDTALLGRITSGVKLISMDQENEGKDIRVASIAKVREEPGEKEIEEK